MHEFIKYAKVTVKKKIKIRWEQILFKNKDTGEIQTRVCLAFLFKQNLNSVSFKSFYSIIFLIVY